MVRARVARCSAGALPVLGSLLATGPQRAEGAALSPAYVQAVRSAVTATPYVAAPIGDDPVKPVAHLGRYEMIEEGAPITGAFLERLKALLTTEVTGSQDLKACEFDPTIAYLFDGAPDVAVVICHGCATAHALLDGTLERFEIDSAQSELLTIAGQLFPEEPRIHTYRHREVWPHLCRRVVKDAVAATTFLGRPAAGASGETVATLGDWEMIGRGPELTGGGLATLKGLLLDPASVTFSLHKRCAFEPTVGYVFETDDGRVEVVVSHACASLSVSCRDAAGVEAVTHLVEVDPAHRELLEIAHGIFPDEPRIRRHRDDR